MSDGTIIFIVYVAVGFIVAAVIGLKDWCDNGLEAASLAIFWPLCLLMVVIVGPFFAVYRIARWISNKLGGIRK